MSLIGCAVLFLTLFSFHFLNFVYQLPLIYGVLCLFVAAVVGFVVIFVMRRLLALCWHGGKWKQYICWEVES